MIVFSAVVSFVCLFLLGPCQSTRMAAEIYSAKHIYQFCPFTLKIIYFKRKYIFL